MWLDTWRCQYRQYSRTRKWNKAGRSGVHQAVCRCRRARSCGESHSPCILRKRRLTHGSARASLPQWKSRATVTFSGQVTGMIRHRNRRLRLPRQNLAHHLTIPRPIRIHLLTFHSGTTRCTTTSPRQRSSTWTDRSRAVRAPRPSTTSRSPVSRWSR